jgi:hypothetical protein
MAERFPKKKRNLPKNPFARDLVQRIRAGEDTAETAQAHLRLVERAKAARAAATERRKQDHSKLEQPKAVSEDATQQLRRREELLARRRKDFVDERIAEQYKVDDRIDLLDEDGNVIPNPDFGQRLDY